jgi:hypothetical protein
MNRHQNPGKYPPATEHVARKTCKMKMSGCLYEIPRQVRFSSSKLIPVSQSDSMAPLSLLMTQTLGDQHAQKHVTGIPFRVYVPLRAAPAGRRYAGGWGGKTEGMGGNVCAPR